jgi:phosphatidylglycerophosphatase A
MIERARVSRTIETAILAYTTVFWIGLLPVSGTFGSMVGVGLYLTVPSPLLWVLFTVMMVTSIPACTAAERLLGRKDPSFIVLDEVIGQLIPLLIARPTEPAVIFLSFILFRIFDALKIPPVNIAERKPGGTGIVMDDVIAGIYTLICIIVIQKLYRN